MNSLDLADEAASKLIRAYGEIGQVAVVLRLDENDMCVIRPDVDSNKLSRVLRIASGMVEESVQPLRFH